MACGVPPERIQIVHLKRHVNEIGRNLNRSGGWELAQLQHLPTRGRLQEDKGASAGGNALGDFDKSQNLLKEFAGSGKVLYPQSGMEPSANVHQGNIIPPLSRPVEQ